MEPNPPLENASNILDQSLPFPSAKGAVSTSFTAQSDSHIDRLPVEVLTMVFLYVRDNPPERFDAYRHPIDQSLSPLNDDALPWTLCKVSRRWRAIAENTPDLWRVVKVEMTFDLENSMNSKAGKTILQRIIKMITTWLANAKYLSSDKGTLELSYHVTTCYLKDYHVAILKTIFEYAEWMKSFDISARLPMMPHLEILAGRVQNLESLRIEVQTMGIYERLNLKAFANAPRLGSVEICGVTNFWRTIQLPWSQLRVCNVNERWIADGLGALAAGSNVMRARITTYPQFTYTAHELAAFDRFDVVVVPNLRSLECVGGYKATGFDQRYTLDKIILPRLEELILRQRIEYIYKHAVDMIKRSDARLTRLELYHACINHIWDVEGLITDAMPSLKTLVVDIDCDTVTKPNADSILLFLLNGMRDLQPGFASLETLRIVAHCWHERRYNRFDYRLLVKLLEETRSRNEGSRCEVPLRTEIEMLGELTSEFVSLTEQLLSSGCRMKETPEPQHRRICRTFYV